MLVVRINSSNLNDLRVQIESLLSRPLDLMLDLIALIQWLSFYHSQHLIILILVTFFCDTLVSDSNGHMLNPDDEYFLLVHFLPELVSVRRPLIVTKGFECHTNPRSSPLIILLIQSMTQTTVLTVQWIKR